MAARTLNPTAASLLGFLHEGPMSGWDLLTHARQVIGNYWSLTQSQVYRELAALGRDGLVEAGNRGARDRQPYALTKAGRTAFAEWIRQVPGAEQIRYPLLLTISFGRHLPPEQLAEFLASHRDRHAQKLAEYQVTLADADGIDPFAAATLDFGVRYETAVLDWLDNLPEELRRPGS